MKDVNSKHVKVSVFQEQSYQFGENLVLTPDYEIVSGAIYLE